MGLFCLGMALILAFHLPQLAQMQKGEWAAFAAIWILAALYGTLVIMDAPIPNITEVIVYVITAIYQWLGF